MKYFLVFLSLPLWSCSTDQKSLSCTEDLSAVEECDADGNCEIVEDCDSNVSTCFTANRDPFTDPYCIEDAVIEE